MGRKRGELPTPAEATVEMGLKDGWVCIDIKHIFTPNKHKSKGIMKDTKVKLKNTITNEETKWIYKHEAIKKYGTKSDRRPSVHRHTDETIAKKVQELANEVKFISWHKNNTGEIIMVKVKRHCGCITTHELKPSKLSNKCPICSAKWKTEDTVCKLVEKFVETMDDKDIDITAERQVTVHMNINGERVARRFDMVVKLRHKYDPSIVRWVVVEYNGEQHYRPVNFGNLSEEELMEQFRQNRNRDAHKRKFCEELNIPMIVIPYWEKNNIEPIIKDKLIPLIYEKAWWVDGRYHQLHN